MPKKNKDKPTVVSETYVNPCPDCGEEDCCQKWLLNDGREIITKECDSRTHTILDNILAGKEEDNNEVERMIETDVFGGTVDVEQEDAVHQLQDELKKIENGITSAKRKILKLEQKQKNIKYALERTME